MNRTDQEGEGQGQGEIDSTPSSFAALIPRLDATSFSSISSRRKRRRRRWSSLAQGETPMTPSPPLPPLPYQLPITANYSEDDNETNTNCIIRNNLTQSLEDEYRPLNTQSSSPWNHYPSSSTQANNSHDNDIAHSDSKPSHHLDSATTNTTTNDINVNESLNGNDRDEMTLQQSSSSLTLTISQPVNEKCTPSLSQKIQIDHTDDIVCNDEGTNGKNENNNAGQSNDIHSQNDYDEAGNKNIKIRTSPQMKQQRVEDTVTNTNKSDILVNRNLFDTHDGLDNDDVASNEKLNDRTMSQTIKSPNFSFRTTPSEQQQNHAEKDETDSSDFEVSILNVVVDHVMQYPTPLEPDEFQHCHHHHQQQHQGPSSSNFNNIKVPVLRIFGPIVSNRTDYNKTKTPMNQYQQQSCCLHIHGAYPYMLARPTIAGPDIDIMATIDEEKNNISCWNNEVYLLSILEEMHHQLEELLQSSLDHSTHNNNNNENKSNINKNNNNNTKIISMRLIRQVDVVYGRGFYTYCPGPPAPFLRIEYYNPQHRWRIKLILERGLQISSFQNGNNNNNKSSNSNVTVFQCYEAHIPYTMQMFKDFHISGLSNVHVQDGRFRHELPKGPRPHKFAPNTKNVSVSNNNSSSSLDPSSFLLRHNVPKSWSWPKSSPIVHSTLGVGNSQKEWPFDCYWTRKETSCDLELDTTIDHLRCRKNKNNYNDNDEDDWRAVPSLHEIWSQEKKRMTELLSNPKDYFIDSLQQPKTTSSSGTKLALQGIHKLFSTSQLLEYKQAMSDILNRHRPFLEKIDAHLMEQKKQNQELLMQQSMLRKHNDFKKRNVYQSSPLQLSQLFLNIMEKEVSNDNSDDEGKEVNHLNELIEHFDTCMPSSPKKKELILSQSTGASSSSPFSIYYYPPSAKINDNKKSTEKDLIVSSIRFTPSPRKGKTTFLQNTPRLNYLYTPPPVALETSSPTTSKENPMKNIMMTPDEKNQVEHEILSFGQRVDCGESVLMHPFQLHPSQQTMSQTQQLTPIIKSQNENIEFLEDYINPATLTPYDDDDGHHNLSLNLDENQNEEEMTEEEMEKSLSILEHPILSRKNIQLEYEENSITNVSTVLCDDKDEITIQFPTRELDFTSDDLDCANVSTAVESNTVNKFPIIHKKDDNARISDANSKMSENELRIPIDEETKQRHCNSKSGIVGNIQQDVFPTSPKNGLLENDKNCCGILLEPNHGPPSRQDLMNITIEKTMTKIRFLPYSNYLALASLQRKREMQGKPMIPEWLGFSKDLNSLYEKSFFTNKGNCIFYFGSIGDSSGVCLEPVQNPPSLRTVRTWLRKERRKNKCISAPKRPPELCIGDERKKSKQKRIRQELNHKQNCANGKSHHVSTVSSNTFKWQDKLEGNQNDGPTFSSEMSPLSKTIKRQKVSFCNEGDTIDLVSMSCTGVQVEEVEYIDLKTCTGVEGIQEDLENPNNEGKKAQLSLTATATDMSTSSTPTERESDPLQGIGQQGGRIHIEGGGGFKTDKQTSCPEASNIDEKNHCSTSQQSLGIMSIEIHVQCRTGISSHDSGKAIAMRPDSTRDAVSAIVYIHAMDPGNGEKVVIIERGGIFTPTEAEASHYQKNNPNCDGGKTDEARSFTIPDIGKNMGITSRATMEVARNERQLLLRLASIIQCKDPDILVSWDTQGYGIGYLIERGAAVGTGKDNMINHNRKTDSTIDMVRLLGRTPRSSNSSQSPNYSIADIGTNHDKDNREQNDSINHPSWHGSGLGVEWDERVGAGAAASSIIGRLVLCGWKIMSEEVKHPNASYLQATAASVLGKRIPYHDDLLLNNWYANNRGQERWRVMEYRLMQASTTIFLLDTLDVIGRAGESARLSGVEFAQSFPGIRGSQYKVEGVLLRALQSVRSDERGDKKGVPNPKLTNCTSTYMSTSLSHDSKSQSQSPWKLLRNNSITTPTMAPLSSSLSQLENIDQDRKHKNKGYFFYSPSKDDCNRQEALECQALTLEPQSGFIFDPVVVCDFTALYPSLVIAYNLCYSTCAGKLDYHSTRSEMGCRGQTTGKIGPFRYDQKRTASVLQHHMKSLSDVKNKDTNSSDRAYVVPTGSIFVSESILKGVLPQVLDELLSTRAMLKKAAKEYKRLVPNLSPAILRQLEARQLALKYVANVTYGYTSATFSGRSAMPLVADSIVECGRRTLTNAINLANNWGKQSNGKWSGAEVVYGDTDSLFIKLPGRTIKEAFVFGNEFCKAVTASNPPPVQLKLEKVYGASLMQTKKKYCGMKYESPNQQPTFEAKGIETVRRDQCALTKKILRNALVTLFRDGMNAVKPYLYRQWSHIHTSNFPVSDFILTGRVRSRYRGGKIGPVQAVLAKRLSEADPGRIVRHKERLPYVIVATPGQTFRLKDCVLTPLELLEQWDSYTIHAAYYITKHVNAALQRCFGLNPFRIDVNSWYENSPKPRKRIHFWPITRSGGSSMISSYFGSDLCALCGAKCKADGSARAVICASCKNDTVRSSYKASMRLNITQKRANQIATICQRCNGCLEDGNSFAHELSEHLTEKQNKSTTLLPFQKRKELSKVSGIVNPMANCVCTDCPVTFERHRLKESQIEAHAVCKALDIF